MPSRFGILSSGPAPIRLQRTRKQNNTSGYMSTLPTDSRTLARAGFEALRGGDARNARAAFERIVAAGNADAADKHWPKHGDSQAVAAWRKRMAEPEAKDVYKLRAATAECINAQARNRGLQRMPVRGLAKVRCVALLFALAHNLMRTVALMPQWFKGQIPSAARAATP